MGVEVGPADVVEAVDLVVGTTTRLGGRAIVMGEAVGEAVGLARCLTFVQLAEARANLAGTSSAIWPSARPRIAARARSRRRTGIEAAQLQMASTTANVGQRMASE